MIEALALIVLALCLACALLPAIEVWVDRHFRFDLIEGCLSTERWFCYGSYYSYPHRNFIGTYVQLRLPSWDFRENAQSMQWGWHRRVLCRNPYTGEWHIYFFPENT